MADSNTIYNGVEEYFDPHGDSGVKNPSTLNWLGGGGSNFWLNETPFWPELDKINTDSAATIAAVKVAYTGTDRVKWLYDRITAIDARTKFIYGRVSAQIDYLKSIGSDAYVSVEKGFTTALSALPVIGGIIKGAEAGAEASRKLDAYKAQSLIQQYTADINQIAGIRKQLADEYDKAGNVPVGKVDSGTKQPIADAPTPWPWYYYAGGALLILVLLIWLKHRQKRR